MTQFSADIVLSAGREFSHAGNNWAPQPWACLANNDAAAQPTHIMAHHSNGLAQGQLVGAAETSFNGLTGRECDALVAPLLVTAGNGEPMIIAKVVDFNGGSLHILFIKIVNPCPPNCQEQFSLVHDSNVGTVPTKVSGALWWEPNQGQGFSAFADPLTPLTDYDDLIFVTSQAVYVPPGPGYETRMISINFGPAPPPWGERFGGIAAGALPAACPAPPPCYTDPIRPPPVWPGFVRINNDLAEFAKVGNNAIGHFTGMNMADENGQPWLVVVDFLPNAPVAYYSAPVDVAPSRAWGLACYTDQGNHFLGNPPVVEGPQPYNPLGWTNGDKGVCVNSYEDVNGAPMVKKVVLEYDPVRGPVVPAYPQGGWPAWAPTVSTLPSKVGPILNGNHLHGWNLPMLAMQEAWVVTENDNVGGIPGNIGLEIQRVDITGWVMAQIAGVIKYGGGFGGFAGHALVSWGYQGTFDGHAATRFWIAVANEQGWQCDPNGASALNTGEIRVLAVDLAVGIRVTMVHSFTVHTPQQGANCAQPSVAPWDIPWPSALIITQNNNKEQVWFEEGWNQATANNRGGILLLYEF